MADCNLIKNNYGFLINILENLKEFQRKDSLCEIAVNLSLFLWIAKYQ